LGLFKGFNGVEMVRSFTIIFRCVLTACVLCLGLGSLRADVTIDATDFTVGATAGANTVVTNWLGSAFIINAPILVGAAPGGATGFGNNSVTVSNFTINATNATAASYVGNGSGNNSLTLLANTVANLNSNLLWIGTAGSGNSLILNGGTLTTTGAGEHIFGSGGSGNSLVITNGGYLGTLNSGFTEYANGAGDNSMTVVGAGSVWTNGGQLFDIGGSGGNQILVANGGLLVSALEFDIGYNTPTNVLIVTGPGALVQVNSGATYVGAGSGAFGNRVVVSNGAQMVVQSVNIGSSGNQNNLLTVTGTGSVLSNLAGNLVVGGIGANSNGLIVSQGGLVVNDGLLTIGSSSGSFGNGATVTDSGSVLTNTGDLVVGNYLLVPGYNSLTVSNGGQVFAATLYVGGNQFNNALNSQATITGPGSAVTATAVHLGGGEAGGNSNSVLVLNGGLLGANSLTIEAGSIGNSISNIGGIYQFTALPTITPNSGIIAITGGTISFFDTTGGDVRQSAVNGINFAGANTFMLNAASNTTSGQTYTFQSVAGNPTNYVNLTMVNGSTAYRGGDVTIGGTGSLLISNTAASFTGLLTNLGVATVTGSLATFGGGTGTPFNGGTLTLNATTWNGGLNSTGMVLGSGTFVQAVAVNAGTLSPGASPGAIGTLVFSNNLTLAGTYAADLVGSSLGHTNDFIDISGVLNITGGFLSANLTGSTTNNEAFVIAQYGSLTGVFAGNNLPAGWQINYDYQSLNEIAVIAIPEPSALGLAGLGILLAIAVCRRRR
jgi:T5SS/PEP-CTERM-associated repeat protein